jgi:hypothetical protein
MTWLRRGWLFAIACAVVVAGRPALGVGVDLLDPGPTLSPELFTHAFVLHGIAWLGVLIASVLAIPTLVVRPGRGAVVLGAVALALWIVGVVLLASGHSPHDPMRVLAASLAFGALQIVMSLTDKTRDEIIAAAGALAAIAILIVPIHGARLPSSEVWMLATTALACGLAPGAIQRLGLSLVALALAPALALGWIATALVHLPHERFFPDSVAMVTPLPLAGAALLGALLLAVTRRRSDRLAHIAVALVAGGATLASSGFFVLGLQGMPRGYLAYPPELQPLHILVGIAAAVSAIGGLLLFAAFRRGMRAA